MALTPWEPFEDLMREPFEGLVSLRDAMNRLLAESFISSRRAFEPFGRIFALDLRETETAYIVEASLPGFKPEEIALTAAEDTLTIRATRKPEEKTEKAGKYVRHERYEGEMSRTITLPGATNPDKVTATYEHGVLTVQVPKTTPTKAKQIKVQAKEPSAVH